MPRSRLEAGGGHPPLGSAQLELFVTLGPPGNMLRPRRGRVGGGAEISRATRPARAGPRPRRMGRRRSPPTAREAAGSATRAPIITPRKTSATKSTSEGLHGHSSRRRRPTATIRPALTRCSRRRSGRSVEYLLADPYNCSQRDQPDGGHDQQPVFAEPNRCPGRPEIGTGSATTHSACWTGKMYDASAGPHLGDEDLDQYLKNAMRKSERCGQEADAGGSREKK